MKTEGVLNGGNDRFIATIFCYFLRKVGLYHTNINIYFY